MPTDLKCGCRIGGLVDRLCPYHEGREDERATIVSYLNEAGEEGLSSQIENGFHIPPPYPEGTQIDGTRGVAE